MAVLAGTAFAAGGLKICVPKAEGASLLTPKHGKCRKRYKLKRLGAEGKTGPEGKQGPEGKLGLTSGELATLKEILPHMTYEASGIGGKPTIQFSKVNVQIINGEGSTNTTNGEGNLIIGYDEDTGLRRYGPKKPGQTGSHNLILGTEPEYTSFGGIVAGYTNSITAPWASVTGGAANTASGPYASVAGGASNTASDEYASVTGGVANTASGQLASVSGGYLNTASGQYASVSGGESNTASGRWTSVSGGSSNAATCEAAEPISCNSYAWVGGGSHNTASGGNTSVSGGYSNSANGRYASVSGGYKNTATCGAVEHLLCFSYDWVGGGYKNLAKGGFSSIFGGKELTTTGEYEAIP